MATLVAPFSPFPSVFFALDARERDCFCGINYLYLVIISAAGLSDSQGFGQMKNWEIPECFMTCVHLPTNE